jgi:hypothetical protein
MPMWETGTGHLISLNLQKKVVLVFVDIVLDGELVEIILKRVDCVPHVAKSQNHSVLFLLHTILVTFKQQISQLEKSVVHVRFQGFDCTVQLGVVLFVSFGQSHNTQVVNDGSVHYRYTAVESVYQCRSKLVVYIRDLDHSYSFELS